MAKVTVIIPVYQVEDYLERCIKSVVGQTMKDIQIILVDDGSPDRCPEICDRYANRDTRITVLHKENGGLSSARNAGLRAAKGDYIFFVDSDDWIDPNTLAELCKIADESQADFVRFRPMTANWPGKADGSLCDFGTEKGMKEGIYSRKEIEDMIFPRLFVTPQLSLGVIVAAWRSLYRREFLQNNGLLFKEDVRYLEDTIFSANVVIRTNRFVYLDGARYYHYFYNTKSITKSYREDRWDNYKRLLQYFDLDFAGSVVYPFKEQLWLIKLYCILSALGDVRRISEYKKRREVCRNIIYDRITREACRHLCLLDVPPRTRLCFELVRLRAYHILAIFHL